MKDEIGGSCPWKGCEFVFDLFTETCWSWFIAWSNSSCARVPCLRPWSWTENSRTHSLGLYYIHVVRIQILREKKKKYLVHVNLRPNQCNFFFVGYPVKKKIRAGEGLNNNLKLLFLVDQIFRRYVDKFVRTVIFFSTCFLFMN